MLYSGICFTEKKGNGMNNNPTIAKLDDGMCFLIFRWREKNPPLFAMSVLLES